MLFKIVSATCLYKLMLSYCRLILEPDITIVLSSNIFCHILLSINIFCKTQNST